MTTNTTEEGQPPSSSAPSCSEEEVPRNNLSSSPSSRPNHISSSSSSSLDPVQQPLPSVELPQRTQSSSSSCDSKFKCNICFETPVDPIVTVCGHMYCWRCLLAWMDHGSGKCPVCKAGVTKSNVIPVYGGGTESSSTPHPASKEGQEAEHKRERAEGRPRAERPEPPQSSRHRGWHTTETGVQFGFFPFGVGIQFGGTGFIGGGGGRQRGTSLTREQQRSQLISTALIIFGIIVIFWAAFIEPLLSQSF